MLRPTPQERNALVRHCMTRATRALQLDHGAARVHRG
jgi:hypothetical protein